MSLSPRRKEELVFWVIVILNLIGLALFVLKVHAQPQTASVTLQWTASGDPKPGRPAARAAAYELRGSTDSAAFVANPLTGVLYVTQSPKDSGQAETLTISGLAAESRYWFYIRLRDSSGNLGAWSNLAGKLTPDTRNPFQILDLR
jgi:chitodextrinase